MKLFHRFSNSLSVTLSFLLFFAILHSSSCQRTLVKASRSFPLPLYDSIRFTLESPIPESLFKVYVGGISYKCILMVSNECPRQCEFKCTKKDGVFTIEITPTKENNLLLIEIRHYKTLMNAVQEEYTSEYKQQIELVQSPKQISMELTVESNDYSLNLNNEAVNRYKRDTSLSVVCKSEGSLPSQDIEFKVECQNRNLALTEQYRLERVRSNLPVEIYYSRYGFSHPPNEVELSRHIAENDAQNLKTYAGEVKGPTETRANLKLKKSADNCELICSQVGVETRKSIHVEYENSVAYILPRPYRDYHRAGQVLNCYADGNPPSGISMDCISPQNSPQLLGHLAGEIIRDRALPPSLNRKGALIFSYDRNEDILFYDSDDEKSVQQIADRLQNLRPQEIVKYVTEDRRNSCGSSGIRIAGSQLIISDNATVGTEIFVACYSENAQNHMRFIINNRLNASLAVVLGICCGLLLLSMIIIGIMIMTKRRQLQQQSAFDARNHAGYLAEEKRLKSKMVNKNYYGDSHFFYNGAQPGVVRGPTNEPTEEEVLRVTQC